jgi:hypothetical protein
MISNMVKAKMSMFLNISIHITNSNKHLKLYTMIIHFATLVHWRRFINFLKQLTFWIYILLNTKYSQSLFNWESYFDLSFGDYPDFNDFGRIARFSINCKSINSIELPYILRLILRNPPLKLKWIHSINPRILQYCEVPILPTLQILGTWWIYI